MIKIRPITAQINTQKFISNFSSLLARAGMASVENNLLQRPRETCSSLSSPVRPPSPSAPKEGTDPPAPRPKTVQEPPPSPERDPRPTGHTVPRDAERRRLGWRWKLLQILPRWKGLNLVVSHRIQQREKYHTPKRRRETPLEKQRGKKVKKGGEGVPGARQNLVGVCV